VSPAEPGDHEGGREVDPKSPVVRYYRTVAPVIDREPREPGELRFWREVAGKESPRRVLDLGCGTGRISPALASEARRLLGIDLSPDMLRRARARTADLASVSLALGDVRRLPVDGGWDLAVAADGLFGHLLDDADRRLALEEISRALRPDGRFVLEGLWLPPSLFRRATGDGWWRIRPLADPEPGELEEVRELWRCDPDSRICRARFTYGPRGGPPRLRAEFESRLWDPAELSRRFRNAGARDPATETEWWKT
jgi:SAM-dependent methyltransferase